MTFPRQVFAYAVLNGFELSQVDLSTGATAPLILASLGSLILAGALYVGLRYGVNRRDSALRVTSANHPQAALWLLERDTGPLEPRVWTAVRREQFLRLAHMALQATEQNETTLLKRLQLLHRASQFAPQDARVNASIVQLILECKDNRNSQVITLRRAAAQGIDPESLHFARGTLALLEGRAKEAQVHLSQAAELGTQMPVTLNNMAMAIYHLPDGDLEQALSLVDGTIEQLPEHPYLHDTRGRILLKLGRFSPAIAALEKGLAAPAPQATMPFSRGVRLRSNVGNLHLRHGRSMCALLA